MGVSDCVAWWIQASYQWPGSQMLHATDPEVLTYDPDGHVAQRMALGNGLNVPALQLFATPEPTGQNVPGGQTSQSSALVITTPSHLVVPPGHGSAAAAPLVQ